MWSTLSVLNDDERALFHALHSFSNSNSAK